MPELDGDPARAGRPWWTLTEVAQRCGVSRSTVRRYRETGRFPNAQKDDATGGWLVPVEDCLAAGLKPTAPTPEPVVGGSVSVPDPADDRARRLEAELADARAALAVERAHRQAAEQLADERARSLSDLRMALRMLEAPPQPAAAEPAAKPEPEPTPPPRQGRWRRLLGG